MNTRALRAWFAIGLLGVASSAQGGDFVRGTVTNVNGDREGGVWVIAQTDALATDFRKIVVTDDQGRFAIPELPDTEYKIWVRGYGLLDSKPTDARLGDDIDLQVETADRQAAAEIYPANYWLSLMDLPSEFTGDATYESQESWQSQFKLNCVLCHQLGSLATRLTGLDAFDHGLKKAAGMNWFSKPLDRTRLLNTLGQWARKMDRGEVPRAPPRPQGLERNVVITQWGWGDHYTYAHDEIATDKRDPTRYAGGRVWGVDLGNDYLLWVNPATHSAGRVAVPTRDGFSTPWCEQTYQAVGGDSSEPYGLGTLGCPWPGGVSAHKGRYQNAANPHNPMMDEYGRVWMTTQIRRQWQEDIPKFCHGAPVITNNKHHRQLAYFDVARQQFELIDTCYGTHHLQFDNEGVLWSSGDDYVIGWLDTNRFDPKDPASLAHAHGYSEVRVDSNGDGHSDQRLVGFHYGIIPNPVDRSVWSAVPPGVSSPPGERGRLHRYDRATDTHEVYIPPPNAYGPRGVDIDSKGMVWTALAGSGHLARFDRSQCSQTWGLGTQCSQGWTLWRTPAPSFANAPDSHTDMHYYLWVDQFNTLGLGRDTIIINGTGSDSLIAFMPQNEEFHVFRIPYPLNTYTRGLDGRIDDANAGWKGRGLWFTNGLDPILHSEIPRSFAGKLQLRPDPLAH